MSNQTVLLRIRPLEYYFFGGETTFSNGEHANYFARSNPLPQQTSVLGLLRQALFGQFPIGESFRADRPVKQDFGKIRGLSPVFFLNGDGLAFLPHALDAHTQTPDPCEKKEVKPLPIPFGFTTQRQLGEAFTGFGEKPEWSPAPYLETANSKKTLTELLISENGVTLERSEVYKSFTRVGITKFRRSSKAEERRDAFYKQEMFKLTAGWSFAVFVEFEPGFDAGFLHEKILPFGGERSMARIEILKTAGSFDSRFQGGKVYPKRTTGQVVLSSDAFVEAGIFHHCVAAVAETGPFRNIVTPKSTQNFGPMKSGPQQDSLYKTGKMTLLKSGSVLFAGPGGVKKIIETLDDALHFQQIGYNHFFTF